jgi:hypothetical protein
MQRTLRVFFAGKLDPQSKHAAPFWREDMAWQLNRNMKNYHVIDSCMPHQRNRLLVEQNLPISTLFSQSCFYIQHSDILVVNLTDDISVGGSQEIFIAKQFGIPVIGISPRGGKFNRLKYELGGKTYWNWVHPFVTALCDLVVQDSDELATALDDFNSIPNGGLQSIEHALNYYQRNASALDTTINRILAFRGESLGSQPKLRIYFAGKMGKTEGVSETAWRDNFAALISKKSHFQSVNLDFLDTSHNVIDENNGKLMFGRDTYLIRSSDVVIVNLSDDISVGGCVEMMLAKLYQRPLIGVAKPYGKFVKPDRDLFGRRVTSYVNPFVAATCDWLIHDPEQLPTVIDQLFTTRVKTSAIIPLSADWYKKYVLRSDPAAQTTFSLA